MRTRRLRGAPSRKRRNEVGERHREGLKEEKDTQQLSKWDLSLENGTLLRIMLREHTVVTICMLSFYH